MHITNDLIQYPTLATANLVSNLINSAKNQIQGNDLFHHINHITYMYKLLFIILIISL